MIYTWEIFHYAASTITFLQSTVVGSHAEDAMEMVLSISVPKSVIALGIVKALAGSTRMDALGAISPLSITLVTRRKQLVC